ncbi:MAG: type II secretion system F family protein [Gammaproteobacteria bacterium]|nr:MAG: type II secretion system F family protein [Gammaproteobacteria bacterium]RLA13971.1 MAG: type II secretion system F family protein [Gammaproteobacteria bacterium]
MATRASSASKRAAIAKKRKPVKISSFAWSSKDKTGKKIKGTIKATDVTSVRTQLRAQGITNPKIAKELQLFGSGKRKITPMDITLFSRQMATMLDAGVPMVMAFDIVGKGHENPSMSELIMTIKQTVEGGSSFAEALAKHPLQFNNLYVNLVAAGEAAGILDDLLAKLATFMEKTEAMKAKVKSAMTYPAAIMVVAFIVTVILLLFVIPQFESLFENFGGELPAPTQFVVDLSKWVQEYWLPMFAIIGGSIYGIMEMKRRSKRFNVMLDKAMLKAPVIGEIVSKGTIARFARTLSTMFAAGVPLVEAMENVAKASGNVVYEEGLMNVRDEISTGTTLTQALERTGLFANMVVQMVSIGEEAGSIDAMLAKVADFYEDEVDNLVDNLTSMLEPLIMSFLGVVVGGLVVAMYLPIFKMGAVV